MTPMRPDFPNGTVTFLFTDMEGSTKLLHELGAEAYDAALAEHRRLLRESFARHGGVEVDTQGDAFFYAFPTAQGALEAAEQGQEALASGPIKVRMGLHTGTPHLGKEGYVGDDVHLGARIAASAHGGQVIVSKQTQEVVDLEVIDLGEHRLKDIEGPVAIYQLGQERFPPLKTISNTNLPRPASSFVGRERETEEVVSLLRNGTRLLTLSGPGGSGKTRLAIEAASELVPDFKAGVFWVGLAALRDSALITETIAQTLGAKDGLQEHIEERELLLLIDNLEQVIESAPELASLLEACPNLKLLCTSRELLRVRGEVEYAVPPLTNHEAVELFCQRSQVKPYETITELCRRLDDLPLAVELAAARTSVLTPEQILDRLSQRLDLLKGGRDAETRHQTLRTTLQWSFELLTPEEQRLFARLAVFAGGCTLDAAEEVAAADLDTLQPLVEKSLLRFTNGRYWMLETIREYAAEKLGESSEEADLCRRHATFFTRFAEEAEPNADRTDVLDALAKDESNLRSALSFSAAGREPALMLRLAGALWRYWDWRDQDQEARGWLEEAIQHGSQSAPADRAKALRGLAAVTAWLDDQTNASLHLEKALAIYRELEDDNGVAGCLTTAGAIAVGDDLDRATALFEEALTLFELAGNPKGSVVARSNLGGVAIRRGDLARARTLYEQVLEVARATGNDRAATGVLTDLAWVAALDDRYDDAARLAGESLIAHLQIPRREDLAECMLIAALVHASHAQRDEAARIVGAAATQRKHLGQSPLPEAPFRYPFDALERDLGEERFAIAYAEGAALSLEDGVELALQAMD
jgi:predicted ATPase